MNREYQGTDQVDYTARTGNELIVVCSHWHLLKLTDIVVKF